ncbi:Golgi-associated plant pathogenesis-related protein 1-like 3 [Homarus americanus]|uniref:Golgi-associated plant pathogenesis-related protein 1-like 3 n=1 Tax=Homarus americanus TaxID=6706 RepID=A0A8J5ML41_HOMAM|nr:Golgi-associated plant pathogenesis-related protein 1-like 3 [Homarus americanus]
MSESPEQVKPLRQVWSVKGATVQGRGTGDVDWARSQFVQECVSEHNRLRDLHSAPPLTLSDQLCNDAQAWANRLAHFGLLEYSSEHGRGENIMTSTAKEELTGSAVALAWYDTGRTFKYEVHGSADLAHAGPFSQVVWESTRAIGVGIARGSEGRTVVVARYWPQGNVGGQFSSNVKPPAADSTLAVIKSGTPTMSRTRQEAHFYVSIALEPPGKNKKAEKEKMAALRLPVKKVLGISGESVSGETLLTHPATIETLGTTFASCRNGAARTSKLFPICCVTPAKTEERWATPSARSQHQTQQPHQIDVATIRRTDDEIMPCATGAKLDSGAHLSAEPSQRHKSTLRASPRLGVSPRLGTSPRLGASPRLGIASRLGSSPKMGALPKLAASARMAASPKLVATSRFGGSPKRGSPKRSMRRGASPKPGSSPRRGVNSRLRALTGTGERNVIVATL